ncbi:unnamed protein product [Anisakis simplex]|uniref:MFS domain-containing protein n=1 Tax=Anisakis simplex TaxID=6269 RepID=A0A0M3JPE7_ANISI|nr:unnamed protein product [Anisakis simplex]
MGLLIGFALHKFGLKPVFPKWKIALGWVVSMTFGFGAVFGLFDYARTGEISDWMRIAYVLVGRNGYALSLAWVTFACATGYGGSLVFAWLEF